LSETISGQIAAAVSSAMNKKKVGQTVDIVQPLTDDMSLEIGILGDGKFIEGIEVPLTLIVDQITGRTGLPKWMLGITRKTGGLSESLSEQEADMLGSDIKWYRQQFEEIIHRIVWLKQVWTKNVGKGYQIEWDEINLRDDKSQAESRKLNSEALNLEIDALVKLLDMGIIATEDELNEYLENNGLARVDGIQQRVQQAMLRRESENAAKLMLIEHSK